MSPKTLKHSDYTIGWICALPKEMTAAIAMLDERHESLPAVSGDDNDYQLGEINGLNIVVACLPIGELGPPSAAKVATRIPFSFPNVKFGLMVGIGGGAPSTTHDVRLGDIVVGIPMDTYGGVIQYDFGKTVQEGKFKRTSMLNSPPDNLLAAVARLKARHDLDGSNVPKYLDEALSKFPRLKSTSSHPGLEADGTSKGTDKEAVRAQTPGQESSGQPAHQTWTMSNSNNARGTFVQGGVNAATGDVNFGSVS
ncbi:MAG: hypothetical protein Q9157_001662 [Trypethelium eluteriae]